MGQSAIEIRKLTKPPMPYNLVVSNIDLRGRIGIEDAWTKLEEFPGKISRSISALKVEILNFDFTKAEFEGRDAVAIAFNSKEAVSVEDLVQHLIEIESICGKLFKALDQEIADK
jgi:hypothetical protein